MDEFKKGDVVMLKSGGPEMTFAEEITESGKKLARCVWFDKNKKCEEIFEIELLEKS